MFGKKDKKEKKGGGESESKEEKYIKKLLAGDEVLFQQKLKWARDTKGKLQDAYGVVSPYRLYFIKDGLTGLGVEKDIALLDMLEIGGYGTDNFTLRFRDKKDQPTISVSTGSASNLIQVIRAAYRQITVGQPSDLGLQISVPTQNLIALQPLNVYGPAIGYVEAYNAFVDYYRKDKTFNKEVWHYVAEKANNSTDLIIAEIPGVEARGEVCVEMAPLCSALRYNTFFKSLVIDHVKRKDIVASVADALRSNRCLTKIVIKGDESSERSWGDLGQALKDNKRHAVMSLEVSHCSLGNRGLVLLSEALLAFSHGVVQLELSHCGLNDKLLTVLFQNFERSFGVSLTLEVINIAGNKFGEASSAAMASWLVNMKDNSQLRRINVSGTGAVLTGIMRGVRSLPHITHLICNNTKIDSQAAQAIASICEGSNSLKKLDVSGASLSADSWGQIVNALSVNAKLSAVEALVGRNSDAGSAGEQLKSAILKGGNLAHLDISEIHFREKHFLEILSAIATLKNLDSLVLDECPRSNDNHDDIANALCDLINRNASIKALSISGGFTKAIPRFLERCLQGNDSLHELNISDNKLGDEGVPFITEMIRKNRTLGMLNLDGNSIGLNGWLAIRNALTKNATLVTVHYPVKDFERIHKDLHDSKKIVLRKLAYDLRLILNPAPLPRNAPAEVELPSSLVPLAPVPQYLAAIAAKVPPPDTTGLVKDEDRSDAPQLHPDSTYSAHERAQQPAVAASLSSDSASWGSGSSSTPGSGVPPPTAYPPPHSVPYHPPPTAVASGGYHSHTSSAPPAAYAPPSSPYAPPQSYGGGPAPYTPTASYSSPATGSPPPVTASPPSPASPQDRVGYPQPQYPIPPMGAGGKPPLQGNRSFQGGQSRLAPAPAPQQRLSGNGLPPSYPRDGVSMVAPSRTGAPSTQSVPAYYSRDGVTPPTGAYPRDGVPVGVGNADYPPPAVEAPAHYERDPSLPPPKRVGQW